MKKYSFLLVLLTISVACWSQPLDRSQRPKAGPAPKIELGKTESFTLPNGLKVFVVENHKVPSISVSLQLDIRPELQGDIAGYQDVVGELLGSGTVSRSKDALDLAVDNIGARIKADEKSMFGTALSRNQSQLIEIISDIAQHSDFKQEELDKIKKQALSGLAADKNNPDAMLSNITQAVNFGKNHPYGEIETEASLNKITLEPCKHFYTTYWRPNVAYMAIVGDVTMPEIKPLIEKYFGFWKQANVPVATYTIPPSGGITRVALSNRDAAVQSVFNVSYPINLPPGHPDVIKAKVTNAVLGGGSQGRLFLNLRESHGWTYGSYSNIHEDELLGNFTAYAKCRNAVTDSAIRETLNEMQKMQNSTITQEDLDNRISYMTGNFAIGLESPQTVAQFAINIERFKMPKDYYTNYLQNLAAVTVNDVHEMAKKYIHPEAANIIVVGNSMEVAKKLEQFGKVEMYDNYGQPTVAATQLAVPAGVSVSDIRNNYIQAVGGEKLINGIHDSKIVYSATIQNGLQISLTEWKSGVRMKREVMAMGKPVQKTVYQNGKGIMTVQGQSKEMTGDDLAEAKQQADIQAILHPEKYGITRNLDGMSREASGDLYIVSTKESNGSEGKEYYDAKTGLLVRQTRIKKSAQGDVGVTIEFSDYRLVPGTDGYKIPYSIRQTNGSQEFNAKIESVEINKGIPDTEFN